MNNNCNWINYYIATSI